MLTIGSVAFFGENGLEKNINSHLSWEIMITDKWGKLIKHAYSLFDVLLFKQHSCYPLHFTFSYMQGCNNSLILGTLIFFLK